MRKTYIIGIDEVGRGPWAGPIVVGGCMIDSLDSSEIFSSLVGLTDSKLLTREKREILFRKIQAIQLTGGCQFAFAERNAEEIDRLGIREANRECMQEVIQSFLHHIKKEDRIEIYIDGCDNYLFDLDESSVGYEFEKLSMKKRASYAGLTGDEWIRIFYRIGGDKYIPIVSAASIIAKVSRDGMMCDFHEKFPLYGFDSHKGYGTRKHQEALLHYGISPIHRKSYAPVKRLISTDS